jgi:molybdopterin synthase catalytic subunit
MKLVELPANLDWIAISESPLRVDDLTTWATRPEYGAVVTFSGTVRNNSGTLRAISSLEYETDAGLAEGRMTEVATEARHRWPTLGAIAIHHRTGRVELGEVAVIIVVSSPHRKEAFEGAEFCIDAVKECVPMWKREFWEGGSAWSGDARTILKVQER